MKIVILIDISQKFIHEDPINSSSISYMSIHPCWTVKLLSNSIIMLISGEQKWRILNIVRKSISWTQLFCWPVMYEGDFESIFIAWLRNVLSVCLLQVMLCVGLCNTNNVFLLSKPWYWLHYFWRGIAFFKGGLDQCEWCQCQDWYTFGWHNNKVQYDMTYSITMRAVEHKSDFNSKKAHHVSPS